MLFWLRKISSVGAVYDCPFWLNHENARSQTAPTVVPNHLLHAAILIQSTSTVQNNNSRNESYSSCVHAVTPNPRRTKRPLNARPLSIRKVNDCRSNGSPNGPM